MTPALEMKGVVKRYGRTRALDGLDLVIPPGSIVGLVGSNGAGKTTAMAVSLGLLHAAGGAISLFGDGPFRADLHAGRVSLLPQDSRFPPHARVVDLLRYYARLQGLAAAERETSIAQVLEWVHLEEQRISAVRTLSHGMNRRLAIAQAFLGTPELVLLDEPLNGLDPLEAARIRDLIRGRHGRQTIVISSHNLADIEILCDQVAFMEKGRLVRQDALDTIVHRRHRVTYLLSRPAPCGDSLRAALPEVDWACSADGLAFTAKFTAPLTPEELNARALGILLAAGAGILEIKRGSDLETEYLNMHTASTGPLSEGPGRRSLACPEPAEGSEPEAPG